MQLQSLTFFGLLIWVIRKRKRCLILILFLVLILTLILILIFTLILLIILIHSCNCSQLDDPCLWLDGGQVPRQLSKVPVSHILSKGGLELFTCA